jgi:hypothetical protein
MSQPQFDFLPDKKEQTPEAKLELERDASRARVTSENLRKLVLATMAKLNGKFRG